MKSKNLLDRGSTSCRDDGSTLNCIDIHKKQGRTHRFAPIIISDKISD